MHHEPKIGEPAPDFQAVAVGGEYGEGRPVSLRELRGRPVILYFYPKDDTPGCTTQACALRDRWPELDKEVALFGVSTDPVESHASFIRKHSLPFPLLSDPEKSMVQDYHVWVEKSMYGKKYMGTERSTFVINAEGQLAAIHRRVKPEEHVDLLRTTLRELKQSKK